jgi:tetratricopeptide (TPR) repeat protein
MALSYYEKALNSDKKSPQLYFNAGLCLKQLKQSDKAIEYFEKAIQLKPNYSKAYLNLGKTLQEKKEHQKAIELYLTSICSIIQTMQQSTVILALRIEL